MSAQSVVQIESKKRVHNKIPLYKKVYSVYQYDQKKYMQIWRKIREFAIKMGREDLYFKISPYKVLRACFIKENGAPKYLGDSKHIYRLKNLYDIQNILFTYVKSPVANITSCKNLQWSSNGVLFFYDFVDGGYAEIEGTGYLPIFQRVKMHIELLRLLRQGKTLRKAMQIWTRRNSQTLSHFKKAE